jgi:hypothetical protein
MAKLKRDAILKANDLPVEIVDIPEWGGEVTVKGLTGKQRDAYEMQVFQYNKKHNNVDWKRENMRAKLIVLSCVDEDGSLLFEESDIQALGEKSSSALDRIFEVAQRLSGITKKDVEELEKDFT